MRPFHFGSFGRIACIVLIQRFSRIVSGLSLIGAQADGNRAPRRRVDLAIFSLAAPPHTRITHPSMRTLYFIPNAPFGGPLTNTQRDIEGLASEVSCNDGIDGAVAVSSTYIRWSVLHPVFPPYIRTPYYAVRVVCVTCLESPFGLLPSCSSLEISPCVPNDCISMARTHKINCFCLVPARRRVLATVVEKSERLIVNFD